MVINSFLLVTMTKQANKNQRFNLKLDTFSQISNYSHLKLFDAFEIIMRNNYVCSIS